MKQIADADIYEIFAATIDEEYSPSEVKHAVEVLGFSEPDLNQGKVQRQVADWLEENRDELVAARGLNR